jgi:hypothetical protein
MKATRWKTLAGLVLCVAFLSACASKSPSGVSNSEYRLIQKESRHGKFISPALYEKQGDPNHVYMRALNGKGWVRMPR